MKVTKGSDKHRVMKIALCRENLSIAIRDDLSEGEARDLLMAACFLLREVHEKLEPFYTTETVTRNIDILTGETV